MKARMLQVLGKRACPLTMLLGVATASGCSSIARKHEANKIPQYGVIDPHQPRELHKAPFPPYVIEPPDELEIAIRPAAARRAPSTFVVQPDGFVHLGFSGDVFVAGLTLADAEERIAEHLAADQKRTPATRAGATRTRSMRSRSGWPTTRASSITSSAASGTRGGSSARGTDRARRRPPGGPPIQ